MQLNINGRAVEVDASGLRTLVDVLRVDLGYTGTKEACGVGVCGACTVLLDGRMVASCITLAAQAAGKQIQTIEGLGDRELLDPLQECFIRDGGFQCGICTPGQLMAAKALLEHNAQPTEDEIRDWMMGNLCRCTGYYQIVESIANAANLGAAQGRDA
ncbi:MAG: (2Fe-2S)-binding protein [Dehalococcoidia bacterium]